MRKEKQVPKDEELDRRMEEMGVPIMAGDTIASKQLRYFEACRHLRKETRTSHLALISALASVASALAAWFTACHH